MKSLEKVLFVVMLITWLGLVLNPPKNDSVEVIIPEVTEEAEPVADISVIKYDDMGIMKASWYGPGFNGRLTANGEIYDQMAFTAAHKSLKFNTLLRVTNLKNQKSIVVRINDRGPYIEGRSLDLSKGAALELGMIKPGVMQLKVEEIKIAGIR